MSTARILSTPTQKTPILSPHLEYLPLEFRKELHDLPSLPEAPSFVSVDEQQNDKKRRIKKSEDLAKKIVKKIKRRKKRKKKKTKIKAPPLTRRQWIIFLIYSAAFFGLGLFTSAPGPLLPDFEKQVNASLSTISFIFSARAVGFVIGSMTSGYILDKYQDYIIKKLIYKNPSLEVHKFNVKYVLDQLLLQPIFSCPLSVHCTFGLCLIIAGIDMIIIPYVESVYVLAVLVSINGICFGNVNTFGNVCLLTLFDTEIEYNDNNNNNTKQDNYESDEPMIKKPDPKNNNNAGYAGYVDYGAVDVTSNNNNNKNNNNSMERELLINENNCNITAIPLSTKEKETRNNNDKEQNYETEKDKEKEKDNENEKERKELERLQKERVGPFMQGLQAFYALGGFIAPLLIQASFEFSNDYKYAFFLLSLFYVPTGLFLLIYSTPIRVSVIKEALEKKKKMSMSMIIRDKEAQIKEAEKMVEEELKKKNKCFTILLITGFAAFLCWYVGAQVGYGMYVTTYANGYLNTSQAVGRLLASANWFGLAFGRLIAVPLSKYLTALQMVVIDLIGTLIGSIILFFNYQMGVSSVWISSIVVGVCMASVWPSMFVWAESLLTVSGTFASLMVFGGALGEFVIPALQGNIMAFYGIQYFEHIILLLSFLLIINLMLNQCCAKRLEK